MADSELLLGIDIGGTNTAFGLVNNDGRILYQASISTTDFATVNELLTHIYYIITKTFQVNIQQITGVGIGAPAANSLTGIMQAPSNIKWQSPIFLQESALQIFKLPCVIDNDANASAIGEMMYGNAKKYADFLTITLGTGVGSGIIINHKLLHGHTGFAGELGHTIVDINGRVCGCGRNGCLETYVATKGILITFDALKQAYPSLWQICSLKSKAEVSTYDIAMAAQSGDKLCMMVFDKTASYLGLALANAVAFSSPQAIILFGGIAQAGSVLLDPLKRYFDQYLLHLYKDTVQITTSGLPAANAAILGAAALAKQANN